MKETMSHCKSKATVNQGEILKIFGRDEKGCLLWTEKKAAVDVDHLPDSSFLGRCRPSCHFLLVDVDGTFDGQNGTFYDLTWSTLTTAFFNLDGAVGVHFTALFITPKQAKKRMKKPKKK